MHPTARTQAEAGGCAQEQAKFWEFHDQLFAAGVQSKIRQAHGKGGDQGVKKELVSISKTVGIDSKKFQDCIDTKKYASEVDKDFEDGQNYGVQSTPSFFINGRLIAGALPFPEFKKIIDEELAK
jgi:protein-disulfide isomerase